MQRKRTSPRTCELCGAAFFTWPWLVRQGGGRFCGIACRTEYQHLSRSQDRICVWCGAAFNVPDAWVRKGAGTFCSRPCKNAAHTRDPIPRTCEQCGAAFLAGAWFVEHGDGRFCGTRCANTANRTPLEARFWAKVNKNGPIPAACPDLGPCWLWTGAPNAHGYGSLALVGTLPRAGAHRVAWLLTSGEMPSPHLDILHICDVPACVRADGAGTYTVNGTVLPRWGHLAMGTPADNLADARAKGRMPHAMPRRRVS